MSHHQPDPVELPEGLRELLTQVDPVPPQVVAAARDSFGWRDLDTQLARLVAQGAPVGAGVRGGGSRLLTYQAGDVTVELEVSQIGPRLRVVGQLVPPQPATVRVYQGETHIEVVADQLGRFTVADLPAGPARFSCLPSGIDAGQPGAEIRTPWVLL